MVLTWDVCIPIFFRSSVYVLYLTYEGEHISSFRPSYFDTTLFSPLSYGNPFTLPFLGTLEAPMTITRKRVRPTTKCTTTSQTLLRNIPCDLSTPEKSYIYSYFQCFYSFLVPSDERQRKSTTLKSEVRTKTVKEYDPLKGYTDTPGNHRE